MLMNSLFKRNLQCPGRISLTRRFIGGVKHTAMVLCQTAVSCWTMEYMITTLHYIVKLSFISTLLCDKLQGWCSEKVKDYYFLSFVTYCTTMITLSKKDIYFKIQRCTTSPVPYIETGGFIFSYCYYYSQIFILTVEKCFNLLLCIL